jgi:hypothetical protein
MPYSVNSCNGGSSRGGEDREPVRVGAKSAATLMMVG